MNPNEVRTILAGVALAAAALAPFALEPRPPVRSMDTASLARTIAREEDHIDAHELARWIRARKPGLRVIDLRPAADFAEHHVPRSENHSIEHLMSVRFDPAETIVLLSDAGGHAAQAWVLLRASGGNDAYFLRGGMREWNEDVLTPTLNPADDTEANLEIAALSRYFGGVPRIGSPAPLDVPADGRSAEIRRRGC